jgi:hypothetical protein
MPKIMSKDTEFAPVGSIRKSFNNKNVDVMVEIDPNDKRLVFDELADIISEDISTADIARPISLIYDNGDLLVEDGHHRILRARETGSKLNAWVTLNKEDILSSKIGPDLKEFSKEILEVLNDE